MERALHGPRQVLGAIDAIDALAERPVDLELVGVLVQVDFLMRMPAVVVRRHVAGNDDHRNRIERGVRDTGAGVRQPGSEMREEHTRFTGRARVAVGGVRRDLLVPRRDEADPALAERVEERDDGVAAEAEDRPRPRAARDTRSADTTRSACRCGVADRLGCRGRNCAHRTSLPQKISLL